MKKRLLSLLLAGTMAAALLAGCSSDAGSGSSETATDETAAENAAVYGDDGQVIIAVDSASLVNEQEIDGTTYPSFDEDRQMYGMMPEDTGVAYTVPNGVEGTYDVYINMKKPVMLWGSTPFYVTVNGEQRQVQPINMNATLEYEDEDNMTDGVFCVAKQLTLAAGDEIDVMCEGGMMSVSTPYLGDMYLYETGAEVAVGFGDGAAVPETITGDASDALADKTILWLGSSVTFGMNAEGYSMADYIEETHPGNVALKYTISGTTLVEDGQKGGSYVKRLQEDIWEGYADDIDLVVVQLSTNDATQDKPLGTISEYGTTDLDAFDVATITGAEEYIINYAMQTYNCPVVFYTGSYYESDNYAAMVEGIKEVCTQYDLDLVNLWDDQEMTDIYGTDQWNEYMASDGIHPLKKGYQEWWGPKFEQTLTDVFSR